MRYLTRTLVVASALLLAACAGKPDPYATGAPATWQLDQVTVRYGDTIGRTASGEDFSSNFVWQGDGGGNRKRQVISMFKIAMDEVRRDVMTGSRPVKMEIEIRYFHALNRWARLFCCGAHRIFADLTISDRETGQVLAQGREVSLGRVALGGIPGLVAVAAGRDQRVRITEGIARRTKAWLARF